MEFSGAVLAIVASFLIWISIYIFRDVLRLAEKIEKRSFDSSFVLVALPLLLFNCANTLYYFFEEGDNGPMDMRILASAIMLAGALLFLLAVMGFTKSSPMTCPTPLILLYYACFPILGAVFYLRFPLYLLLSQTFYLVAEMIIGIGFILLSRYADSFNEVTVSIGRRKICTRYVMASYLLLTGVILPIDGMLKAVMTYAFMFEGIGVIDQLITLKLAGAVIMTSVGIGAVAGMLLLKRTFQLAASRRKRVAWLIQPAK